MMRHITMLSIILVIVITIAIILHTKPNEANNQKLDDETIQDHLALEMELIAYEYATQKFINATTDSVAAKIKSNESFVLYIGRETCQWCRKLVPILGRITDEKEIAIYYLDSTNSETDEELSNFREKYGIKTVPAIIKFDSNGYKLIDFDVINAEMPDLKMQIESQNS